MNAMMSPAVLEMRNVFICSFNEEMIETLFGYTPAEKKKNEAKKDFSSQDPSTQFIQIIDSKKSQNLSILLKALNVTIEEVCDALQEGEFISLFLFEFGT